MSHAHSHTALAETGTPSPEAKRVTWAGLGVNLGLSVLKLICGLVGSSQALVADAVHTVSDSSTDVAVLIGMRYWSAPADEAHPHGHRRIETVITAAIAVLLAGVAVGLVSHAVVSLRQPHPEPPGWIALVAAVASIGSKEGIYRWTLAVSRRIKSPALAANAWHHRSDSLSSVPVVLAVIGARVRPEWIYLDHIGAAVVSVFILRAAWQAGWPALKELVDTGAPAKDLERIREIAMGVEPVCEVHAVRTRYVGPGLAVDLHVRVEGALSVREGHDVSEEVKRRLLAEGPELVDVVVHLEPCDEPHAEASDP
jgi:cation diffusion facilitator family transporter